MPTFVLWVAIIVPFTGKALLLINIIYSQHKDRMVTICASIFTALDLYYPEIFLKDQITAHSAVGTSKLGL